MHPNVPTRKMTKQNSLEDKEAYLREDDLLAKKCHKIADYPKEEILKQVCQNRIAWFVKLEGLAL
jgi:hypothetical protein